MKTLALIQSKVKATKSLRNEFGKFNYRNVESICEAVKPILAELECSLILSDDLVLVGDRFYLKATATIYDGDGKEIGKSTAFAREALDKKGMDSAQLTGACSSYARKYALGGLLLLDDNKDIDSLENSNETPKKREISELNSLKISLAKKFKEFGLSENDYTEFFEFVECDKNQIAHLHKLLDMDLQGAIKEFYKFKGGEND